MDGEYVQVGEEGPCQKICGAAGSCCLGIILLPITLLLLGWNENNFVCESSRILYAESNAKDVGCSRAGVEGQFAFFSCPVVESSLKTFTPCSFDPQQKGCSAQLPISFQSASGQQTVEMYQCAESCSTETETHKNSAGQNVKTSRRVCEYRMEWASQLHDSSRFERSYSDIERNGCPDLARAGGNPRPPSNLELGENTDYAQTIVVGDSLQTGYTLNQELVSRLSPDTSVQLSRFGDRFTGPRSEQPWDRPLSVSASTMAVSGDGEYLMSCSREALGCVRVGYKESGATRPSVIAHVAAGGVTQKEPIPGSWGCPRSAWESIRAASLTKDEMIAQLRAENKALVWFLRVVGCLLAWLSVYSCFAPISAAADIVGDVVNWCPCGGYLEDFLEGVVGWVLCLLSCGIGCSCALFVIATVWLFMRPLIGGGLLAVCALLWFGVAWLRSRVSGKKKARLVDNCQMPGNPNE